jgi:hypothetical protein
VPGVGVRVGVGVGVRVGVAVHVRVAVGVRVGVNVGVGVAGAASHTSPVPSPSESAWFGLYSVGQLSQPLGTPSRSSSCDPQLPFGVGVRVGGPGVFVGGGVTGGGVGGIRQTVLETTV